MANDNILGTLGSIFGLMIVGKIAVEGFKATSNIFKPFSK